MAYRTIAITPKLPAVVVSFPNILKRRKETEQNIWISPHLRRMDADDILLSLSPISQKKPCVGNGRSVQGLKSKATALCDVD